MEISNQQALVTGGCGFIGCNLIEQLLALGYQVRVLDDLSLGQPNLWGDEVDLVVGDIRDGQKVQQAMQGIDAVVHLAAHTDVRDSVAHPQADVDVNVMGTLSVLAAARDAQVKRFVFASSNAPLGEQFPPVHEEQIPHPKSPYGASKLAGEALCQAFYASYGLPTVVLRFANVYGPRSTHKSSVVAKFIRRMLKNEPLIIYGDGQQTRDFVHVSDICQGLILALRREEAVDQVFQIGSGVETSLLEFVGLLKAAAGREDIEVQFGPPQPGEIWRNYSQIDKAQHYLGYRPQLSLADGLAATYNWFLYPN
ncbi:MAG: NDP-sugar dehydratase or epimerase [Chloroflexota bacterium]|nr:MAG: NDP-sugar dehydratase or epimerase [Chloroflexota bacterium]